MRLILLSALLWVLPFSSKAASVTKCVDATGKVSFVQNANCPRNSSMAGAVDLHNARPSGDAEAVLMAPAPSSEPGTSRHSKVVGINKRPAVEIDEAPATLPAPPRAARPANQPCVKTVEQMYTYKTNKNGKSGGGAGIRKVLVPC